MVTYPVAGVKLRLNTGPGSYWDVHRALAWKLIDPDDVWLGPVSNTNAKANPVRMFLELRTSKRANV